MQAPAPEHVSFRCTDDNQTRTVTLSGLIYATPLFQTMHEGGYLSERILPASSVYSQCHVLSVPTNSATLDRFLRYIEVDAGDRSARHKPGGIALALFLVQHVYRMRALRPAVHAVLTEDADALAHVFRKAWARGDKELLFATANAFLQFRVDALPLALLPPESSNALVAFRTQCGRALEDRGVRRFARDATNVPAELCLLWQGTKHASMSARPCGCAGVPLTDGSEVVVKAWVRRYLDASQTAMAVLPSARVAIDANVLLSARTGGVCCPACQLSQFRISSHNQTQVAPGSAFEALVERYRSVLDGALENIAEREWERIPKEGFRSVRMVPYRTGRGY